MRVPLIKMRSGWAFTDIIIPNECVQPSNKLCNTTRTNICKAKTVISSSASLEQWISNLKGHITCSQANSELPWTRAKATGQDLRKSNEATQPYCLYIWLCRVRMFKMSLWLYLLSSTAGLYFACRKAWSYPIICNSISTHKAGHLTQNSKQVDK